MLTHKQCPKCGGKMKYRHNKFVCTCGYEVDVT